MDTLKFLKENKLFDIGYRFVLWISLGYALYSASSALEGAGGESLRKAIATPPSSDFTQMIGVIGVLIGGVALLVKEGYLKSKDDSVLEYLLSKITTDLVLAPFNIMSFVLGWGLYLYIKGAFEGQNVAIFGILLLPYTVIMAFLALISLAVRAKEGEYLHRKIYSESMVLRILLSISLVTATFYVIFFH